VGALFEQEERLVVPFNERTSGQPPLASLLTGSDVFVMRFSDLDRIDA
jgi:hypothetical protein